MTEGIVEDGESIHATAIVVGPAGLLFVGPSGSGKSSIAFACLTAARARGWNAALIADDRTCLVVRGGRCIASCPEPIRGLLELRGTGIVTLPRLNRAVVNLVVEPAVPSAATRLPPESETFSCNGIAVPLLRLWHNGAADPLSCILASRPELFLAR
ncbi:MAG: HPr kinase/phosphatase C-terminal domain-containing protein [Hoeflea sp.]|uniref:HPr kinase/phosphorylase n=1 Tax=Hoeflea sp. TaxID=1940281 RepID=UPI001D984BB8|nr:HPr kinase/phosphatase C-terminal domain-containing protein [Hoeflea sp.]MBU4531751.1 HPr kinase/phosphatase C-terminal domain-containing protein [Alphaproteobacteria bacterium]MBU4544607.1 HPr kinase/phosphatase C-terminal domain-containing protein [Alphaproteobacteria bacterium]MBU4552838.1 HPr kinase/phosphatase C-terminal domain-containing protein [Alphaproteobacteria bacterium]MBV1725027.1 HPr kinase/phosphatase C-terminal domain-containing protein [Hoeflea sp.]MBV1761047.1 HPr kinase/